MLLETVGRVAGSRRLPLTCRVLLLFQHAKKGSGKVPVRSSKTRQVCLERMLTKQPRSRTSAGFLLFPICFFFLKLIIWADICLILAAYRLHSWIISYCLFMFGGAMGNDLDMGGLCPCFVNLQPPTCFHLVDIFTLTLVEDELQKFVGTRIEAFLL